VKGHGEKFGRKKEQAIAALLSNPTIEEAAKAAGIGSVTLWRWLQDPGFKMITGVHVVKQRNRQQPNFSMRVPRRYEPCAKSLRTPKLLQAPGVMAARNVLDFGLKAIELENLEEFA
jgi:hypothetical protein